MIKEPTPATFLIIKELSFLIDIFKILWYFYPPLKGGRMPQTRTALRALKKAQKRRLRNLKVKRTLKETIKKFKKLLQSENFQEAEKFLPLVYKTIDMAASKGVIHKNTASRKKSRLSKKLHQLISSQKHTSSQ